jgi:molybdopterin molybdotransferase
MRARVSFAPDGTAMVEPFAKQDSSLTSILSLANALMLREAHAPAARVGEPCQWLPFGN